jgi:hypothetical protein
MSTIRGSSGKEPLHPRHRSEIVIVSYSYSVPFFPSADRIPNLGANSPKIQNENDDEATRTRTIANEPPLTLLQKTDNLPAFTFRVSCLWRQFLDEVKMPGKQAVELETGYRERRAASLRRLTRIPWIQKKNRQ